MDKCKKLHVGHLQKPYKCQELFVDKWSEVELRNDVTGDIETDDLFEGEHAMEEKSEDKYLGDIISTDGRNMKNIKARIAKGKGIVNNILTMLEGIPFGKHYFEVGIILRNSILVSSMLFNSEAWYNLTSAELDLFETIDLLLLRQLLHAPKGTPKEMIYLELGCIPFREIIRERRLGFLYYILKEDTESMIHRCFQSQFKNRTKRDWVTTIIEDLKYIDMENETLDTMKNMKKASFMAKIKEKILMKTLDKFQKEKESHSKVRNLEHNAIKMQKYLQPNGIKMTKEEAQLIFHLRCRVTEAKINLRGKYDNLECGACGVEEETQQHIIKCKVLNRGKEVEDISYENLFNGTVKEKLRIAHKFEEHFSV